eukprot:Gb_32071 [translate_table: standard]
MIHNSKSSSSSNSTIGPELQKTIWRWCEATGLPTTVRVGVEDRSFKLHKYPLVSRSGYLKQKLSESSEIILPNSCPGGAEIFELVANFCYGSSILMDPLNVSALRCAAEFLEMSEEFGRGNLCERSDLYLTQVVLQSWEDTLIVLQKCQCLLPLAEELLIVSRCIESLAFMACMEVLDPEHRRTRPGISSSAPPQCQFWSDLSASLREATAKDWWIKDLLALPFQLFERIIASIRRQGMEEKFVSPVIVMYANKWILSKKTHQMYDDKTADPYAEKCTLLEAVIRLLPFGRRSAVPVHFLFSLLTQAINSGSSNESKTQLQARIASQLDFATIEDFLLPVSTEKCNNNSIALSPEVESMQCIVSIFISQQSYNTNPHHDSELMGFDGLIGDQSSTRSCDSKNAVSTVANLWDEYLAQIAFDARLAPTKFSELIEIIPSSARRTHDLLYKAIDTYLMAHPHISQQERYSVCKFLSCQKLSQETCIHAVQNELMPLRLIVQAMFMQQLHTRQVVHSNSHSMRFDCSEPSTALNSNQYSVSEDLKTRVDYEDGLPLGLLLKRDAEFRQAESMKADFEATSFRLKNLEQELNCMKKNLQESKENHAKHRHINSSVKSESFRLFRMDTYLDNRCRKSMGISPCIGANWVSHGNFAHKLLNTFQKLGRIGFGKSKHDKNKNTSRIPQSNTESAGLP